MLAIALDRHVLLAIRLWASWAKYVPYFQSIALGVWGWSPASAVGCFMFPEPGFPVGYVQTFGWLWSWLLALNLFGRPLDHLMWLLPVFPWPLVGWYVP